MWAVVAAGVLASMSIVGAAGRVAPPPASGEYRVLDYGAKCDGGSDDTQGIQAAINAAFPGGTVVLPATRCVISRTLVFGDPTQAQRTSFISLQGSNPITSQLAWKGGSDGAVVRLVRNKYFTFQRFGLLNMSGARGALVGLELGGYGNVGGTETLQGDIRQVNVAGFHVNVQAGSGAAAASEIRYDHLELTNADICWQSDNFNTLNHVFTMLSLSACEIGVRQGVGNLTVRGGATDNNGVDFYLDGDISHIEGVRAELRPGGTFVKVHILNGSLTLEHNQVTGSQGEALHAFVMRFASVSNNVFNSPIVIEQYVWPGMFLLENNMLWAPDMTSPVAWPVQHYSRYRFAGNANFLNWQPFTDEAGVR